MVQNDDYNPWAIIQSKKVQIGIVTAIASILARLGFDADTEIIAAIVALGGVIIGSIATQDAGKEKARIEQATILKKAQVDLQIAKEQARAANGQGV